MRPCDDARNMDSTSSSAHEPLWIETFSAHELVVLEYCFTAFLNVRALLTKNQSAERLSKRNVEWQFLVLPLPCCQESPWGSFKCSCQDWLRIWLPVLCLCWVLVYGGKTKYCVLPRFEHQNYFVSSLQYGKAASTFMITTTSYITSQRGIFLCNNYISSCAQYKLIRSALEWKTILWLARPRFCLWK